MSEPPARSRTPSPVPGPPSPALGAVSPPEPPLPPPPTNPLEEVIGASTELGTGGTVGLGAMFARNLSTALLVGLVPILVALGSGVTAWVGSAVPALREARAATYTAEADYHAALRQAQPLLTALTEAGAPVGNLEHVWFTFEEAPDTGRLRPAADALMSVLVAEVEAARAARGEEAGHLVVLLSDATRARHRASVAWHGWAEGTSTLRGRLIVLLGFTAAPPPELARYDRPLPEITAPP